LLESVRGRNKAPGDFRRVQNYIGDSGTSIEQAKFVPPSPENVMPAMSNWEKYLHVDDKDPLVQLAIIKAQFELIHPFLDGNGRIGRILIPIFLYFKELLSSPIFYLSSYLEKNRSVYYERLNAISRDSDWNGWIRFFLGAVVEQAIENSKKARAILDLYDRMKQTVPEITRSQHAIQVIDTIFRHPVFQGSEFTERTGIPKVSSSRILKQLKDHNLILTLFEARGRRSAYFMFSELIRITC
jgi:Fic family protein